VRLNDSQATKPVFFTSNLKHWYPGPTPQKSYEKVKEGAGVGVGGGSTIGSARQLPLTVAYRPHSQHVRTGLDGGLMTQFSPAASLPTTSQSDQPEAHRQVVNHHGPVRQLVFPDIERHDTGREWHFEA
jgi:hypothetical protein